MPKFVLRRRRSLAYKLAAFALILVAAGLAIVLSSGLGRAPGRPASTDTATPPPEGTTATAEPTMEHNGHDGPVSQSEKAGCTPTASTGTYANGVFKDTFDGSPASPLPWCPPDWDIAVNSRDQGTWYQLEEMAAQHGADCGAPPATHAISNYLDTVHQCKDHVMTSMFATGYGVIYLTPSYLVNFSNGEAVISWDMSTTTPSKRDFVDLWITPYQDNLQLPLDDYLPDLQGEPRDAVQIRMDQSETGPIFRARVVNDFQSTELASDWWTGYHTVLTPDAARRDTFELRISKTHIKFGMPKYNLWWIDANVADLGWSTGAVQFGHHSYNPFKDGNGGPNTWHWDNVSIAPAIPFTMVKAKERFVDTDDQVADFTAPAPDNGHLRFSAIGQIKVSFDGGKSWLDAQKQAQERDAKDHFATYWMAVPKGTTSVTFRGGPDDYQRDWMAKDFAFWAPPPS
ncbi:hypothetical protein AYO38_03075 [bacterium SCGC AG-212-C10]|nr:hypothetical protein AYO38_03075 [bacterium SCGC AG-212-C10]